VLHAGLAATLTRLGAGTDIPIGTPIAGRGDPALDEVVGFFVNTLVLRTDTAGDPSFDTLLDRVRGVDLAAYANSDVPFERLVELLNPARSLSWNPLFQTMLVFQDDGDPVPELPGVDAAPQLVRVPVSQFDLTFRFTAQHHNGVPSGIDGVVEFSTDLFDRGTVERLAERLLRVLAAVVADPEVPVGAIDLLSPGERERLLRAPLAESEGLAHKLFEEQVRRVPEAVAVAAGEVAVSYAELNARANRFARWLVDRGVRPEDRVAVLLPPSVDLVAVLLGVLKAGAAYVPIDVDYPEERIAYLVSDSAARIVVTAAEVDECTGYPAETLDVPVRPGNAAYVIYTSGSTGRPKGVVVEHRSLGAYLLRSRRIYPGVTGESLLHSSVSFDLTITALFTPLISGGCVRIGRLDGSGPRPALMKVTPSHLELLTSLPDEASPSACLVVGGEALFGAALAPWRARHPDVLVCNDYGPTESTVSITDFRLAPGGATPEGAVPIGRPFPGVRVYLLDAGLSLVPQGVPGELYIAGAFLARGYHNRPGLTAERFVADPFGAPGTRMYRTGDLARWRVDGELEYLGRVDDQVKVRGFRIEPGEIRSVLAWHPGVARAAVLAHEFGPGDTRLLAYVVPAAAVTPDELRAHVAARLPDYMVPSAVLLVDELPLTAHGKLDRGALPLPAWGQPVGHPRTPREAVLAELFAEALGVPAFGVHDDFFALGGHSLLAVRLINRVRAVFGAGLTIRGLFEAPTVAALAERIGGAALAGNDLAVLLPLRAAGSAAPIFCLPPAAGIGWVYSGLLRHIGAEHPIYALQAPGLAGEQPSSMAALAGGYTAAIRSVQPSGPYHLLGWSFGGLVAHAVATGLQAEGERVDLLAVLDSYPPEGRRTFAETVSLSEVRESLGGNPLAGLDEARVLEVFAASLTLAEGFTPEKFEGDLALFRATADKPAGEASPSSWAAYVTGRLRVSEVDCRHGEITGPGPIAEIGRVLAGLLRGER
jgi:amino acid adenylation domain-containing protein